MPHAHAKEKVQLDLALATPVLLTNQRQTVYLRLCLTGFQPSIKTEPSVPLHLVLVIDSSMPAEKISQAKEAAMMIMAQLRPTDRIAIVAGDQPGEILLPTTQAQHQKTIGFFIETLVENRQTTLFASLAQGITEILTCRRDYQIERLILLSDGLGSYSVNQMNEFCRMLAEKDITLTTMGFGADHNQDLMRRLSQSGHGNHALIEKTADIARVFTQELTEMAQVIARKIEVTVNCSENVRPLKVLGREAKIEGGIVSVQLPELYNERYLLLELEVSPDSNQQPQTTIAKVIVTYCHLKTHRSRHLTEEITATLTHSRQQVTENINTAVMTAVTEQLAVEKDKLALLLDEQRNMQKAKQLLLF